MPPVLVLTTTATRSAPYRRQAAATGPAISSAASSAIWTVRDVRCRSVWGSSGSGSWTTPQTVSNRTGSGQGDRPRRPSRRAAVISGTLRPIPAQADQALIGCARSAVIGRTLSLEKTPRPCNAFSRMFARMEHAVRVVRFGAAFVLFGAGSLVLGTVHLPRVRRRAANETEAHARSVEAVASAFRRYAAYLRLARLVDIDVEPIRVTEPSVLVANHPTIIDVICVLGATERTVCVAGSYYYDHPLIRGVLHDSRFIDGGDGGASSTE